MKMQSYVAILVCVLVLLCGCNASEENQVSEPKPRAVRVQTVTSSNLPIVVNSVGRLAPNKDVVLSAQVSGILMQYDKDVGCNVGAQGSMAKLDAADYQLALSEAKANLEAARVRLAAAENTFERAKRLLPAKAITPELYDQSEATYKSSKASVAQLKTMVAMAKRRVDKTNIAAPFDGYITQRFVELGQNVAIGDPIMRLADMQTMRVKIYINELDYVHLDKEDPVSVTVEAFSKTPIDGRVDKIGIQADSRTNTFEVEILVDNPDNLLKAGLTARVAVQTKMIADAVMIEQNSIIFREKRKEVFIVEEGDLAAARHVKLGRVDGSKVQILEGLAAGENLVVAGGQYLKPGEKVTVMP